MHLIVYCIAASERLNNDTLDGLKSIVMRDQNILSKAVIAFTKVNFMMSPQTTSRQRKFL